MMAPQNKARGVKHQLLPTNRVFWVVSALMAGAGVIAANAHLVYVAIRSQPACVEHAKQPDTSEGTYRAAKSGCTWRAEKKND